MGPAASKGAPPMRQYEIRWATLREPVGRRPVVLLSRNAGYAYLNKVIVAEVTSTIRGIPEEVPVGRPRDSCLTAWSISTAFMWSPSGS